MHLGDLRDFLRVLCGQSFNREGRKEKPQRSRRKACLASCNLLQACYQTIDFFNGVVVHQADAEEAF